jgi:hypothetical protein
MRKLLPITAFILLFINTFIALSQLLKVDVPAWLTDAVFYQIFPERFYNGDTTNDRLRRCTFPANLTVGDRIQAELYLRALLQQ